MKKYGKAAVVLLLFFACVITFRVYAESDEKEAIAERMEKAATLGLTEWVDDEGYLIDDFFAGKSDAEVSSMGLDGLVRVMTEEEIEAFMEHLKAGIEMYSVTYYKKVSQKNPDTGNYLYTGMFKVNGKLAFCIERSAVTPARGSSTGTRKAVTNTALRKVLYYGYNGPKSAGYTYVETALAAGEANGDGDNSLGRKILAEIKKKATPPSTFKVWRVTTNGGDTQDLAYYTVVENGYGMIQKVSSKPDFTDGNTHYSLAGAVFKVYKEETCETVVETLTTDEDGNTDEVTLTPGTYYVREEECPQGYELNSNVHELVVQASETTTLIVPNEPKMNVKLVKFSEGSDVTLPDAVFELTRPDGTKEALVTDESGSVVWENIKEGSYEIRELEAPKGYHMNRNVITFEIGQLGKIDVTSQVDTTSGDVRIKYQEDGNLLVEVEDRVGRRFPETGGLDRYLIFGSISLAFVLGQFTRNYTQTTKRGLLTTNKG